MGTETVNLWRSAWIEAGRIQAMPAIASIVVAVDPPTIADTGDLCGIIVAGLDHDGRAYVLADRSLEGRSPSIWARAAVEAYRDFSASCIVAEVDQGGPLVASILRQVDHTIAIRQVRTKRGKWLRAEPVAAIYAEGRVSHVGRFPELEAQMGDFGTTCSPSDRINPLVLALTALFDANRQPSIWSL